MIDLTNIPQSIADEVKKAAKLIAESNELENLTSTSSNVATNANLASQKRNQALAILSEVASKRPELGTLLLATLSGHTQLEDLTVETHVDYVDVERKWLGLTVAVERIPQTTTKTITKTYKLS